MLDIIVKTKIILDTINETIASQIPSIFFLFINIKLAIAIIKPPKKRKTSASKRPNSNKMQEIIKKNIASQKPLTSFFLIHTKLTIEVIKPIKAKSGINIKTHNPNNAKIEKKRTRKIKLKRDITKENIANLLFINPIRDNSF